MDNDNELPPPYEERGVDLCLPPVDVDIDRASINSSDSQRRPNQTESEPNVTRGSTASLTDVGAVNRTSSSLQPTNVIPLTVFSQDTFSDTAADVEDARPGGGVRNRPNNMAETNKGGLLCLALVLASIGALLVVILVPLSFSDLDYYEMGFLKKRSTGTVDRSKVYFGGRHFVGVDNTFKIFRADAHLESFSKISVFNKDKLQVTLTCSLQYFLMPDDLALLHDAYDLDYKPVLRKTAQEAIKNSVTQFSVDEFRLERDNISTTLFEAARKALGGICCPKNCFQFKCYPGCKPYATCSLKDKGLFAFVKFFQLQAVDVTADQKKKYLQTVIEQEKQDTENFKQEEKIVRKKTEQEKIQIQNTALEVSQNATATATLISAQAAASAKAIVEDSRNSGLQIIYSTLNITEEKHKKSLDYIRTLRNHKNAYMYVGFTTLVGREGK